MWRDGVRVVPGTRGAAVAASQRPRRGRRLLRLRAVRDVSGHGLPPLCPTWASPFPLPRDCKFPPPVGCTGWDASPWPGEVGKLRRAVAAGSCNWGWRVRPGHVALDFDGRSMGDTGRELLRSMPQTWQQRTPDGWHLVFRGQLDAAQVMAGVDVIRPHHRYLVAPGSRRESGCYAVELDLPLAELPDIDIADSVAAAPSRSPAAAAAVQPPLSGAWLDDLLSGHGMMIDGDGRIVRTAA